MQDRIHVMSDAITRAGAAVLSYDPRTVAVTTKTTAGDLITAADTASEQVIVETIKAAFPKDLVISEETSKGQELLRPAKLAQLSAWVIDPIDGTNNFKRGMAYSGISIGYIENGVPVLGMVYDPYRKELYSAQRGGGASRNGETVQVGDRTVFDPGTRVCTSNSYDEGGTQANLDRYTKLGHVWVDVLGSAVLIMTDIASGRLDLYHHNGLKPWDNAAAFLIAEEAGAKIVDLKGHPVNWLTNEVVIGNSQLVDSFISTMSSEEV